MARALDGKLEDVPHNSGGLLINQPVVVAARPSVISVMDDIGKAMLGTLAFGRGILFRRDSCSDGHSVVVFTTFLLLDFWLCMRKEKQIQKTARGRSPQSVMYLPNEICALYRHQIFSLTMNSL